MSYYNITILNIKNTWLVILIFIFIVISQYVFVYLDAGDGIIISLLLILIIYIIISLIKLNPKVSITAESISLIPIYVLFTASLPWFFIKSRLLLPMVYSLIIGLCFWHIHHHKIDLKDVGIVKGKILKYTILGILFAIPTGIIEFLILHPEPAFPTFEIKYLIQDIIYMTFFVGFGEELLFRGIIMNDLKKLYRWEIALIGQAFLFGIMHMTWRSIPELFFTGFAGLILGYLYHKTGSLTLPIAMHAMNNVMLVGIMPYLL